MKRFLAMCVVLSLVAGFSGCDKKASETKSTSTVTTPEGSTTVTDTQKVETSGENPPPAK